MKGVDIAPFWAHTGVRSRFCLFLFLPDQGSSKNNVEFGRKAAKKRAACGRLGRATASSADAAQFKKGKCSQVRQASARCVATPMSEVFKTLAYFGGFVSAAGN